MYNPSRTSVSTRDYSDGFEYAVVEFNFERPRVVFKSRDYTEALADIKRRRKASRAGRRWHLTIVNV